jgi:hypothetical protein
MEKMGRVAVILLFFTIILKADVLQTKQSVIDTTHNLEWSDSQTLDEYFDIWRKANSICLNLSYGGHHNWRLPTTKELVSLSKNSSVKKAFRFMQEGVYWSSDDDQADDLNAMIVFIGNGFVSSDDKCGDNKMICVRETKE